MVRRCISRLKCAVVAAALVALIVTAAEAVVPARLRCELAVDPMGIDVSRPRLSWIIESDVRGERQTAYQILAATSIEALDDDRGDLWDSTKVDSDETLYIPYGGRPLGSSQQVFWKVRVWDKDGRPSAWSTAATWTMGVLDPNDWKAKWIVAPWQSEALLLRREFRVKPGLQRAIVHVCGLGQYEMAINGQKAGNHLLAPGWSKYNKTCLYETHDITPLVREGANAVGIMLGDGMFHTERRNRFSKFQGSFGPLRAIAQIELEYARGLSPFAESAEQKGTVPLSNTDVDNASRELVVTDESWRVHPGPVTYNDIYGGEDFDARRIQAGWDRPGFDDAVWENAVELVRPSGTLRGMTASAPPIAAIESVHPVAITPLSDSRDIVDLGQNTSYMPRITVSGPAGSAVRLTHAEVLHPDGTINRDTCGGNRGPAWWQYTKATDEKETWFPQFFYAGCRYLQVDKIAAGKGSGTFLPPDAGGDSTTVTKKVPDPLALPRVEELAGIVVHSTAEPVGDFQCSNELVNRIRELVRWAQRSNMVSVLTDCPHREKLGWLEQYHLNGPAIRYEFDVARIFRKAMRDMADSQTETGLVPNIAPEYTEFPGTFRAAAEWGAAFIVVPWQHFQFTGDASLFREHYAAMKRYMEYLASRATVGDCPHFAESSDQNGDCPLLRHIVDEGLGDWYDLGPADRPGAAQLTPPPVTATAFYFYDAQRMSQIAALVGHEEDAKQYATLAEEIRTAWRREFRRADTGTYATGSQCANAIALVMDLAEPEDRERTLAAIVEDVRRRGNTTTAGDVGFRYLLQALAQAGRSDVVYDMMIQDKRPGYAYQLKRGATSLTEAWDANHHASHNHFMLGQITEWLYKDLCGINCDPSGPGFKKIIIRPAPVSDLQWARASYNSIRGKITSSWRRDGNRFTLNVTIPANTTATVFIPARSQEAVTESGKPAEKGAGIRFLRTEKNLAVFAVQSGRYEFVSER